MDFSSHRAGPAARSRADRRGGSCLTTIHRCREAEVRALPGISADVEVAALIPQGWPVTRSGRPPHRPLAEVTFADRWGQPTGW